MINTRDLELLEAKIQEAQAERNKAEGAIQTIEADLKKQFDVNSIEEAKELQATLGKRLESLNERLETMHDEIKAKMKDWQ